MATMTVDGHSLSVDGRRIWLVSGAIHPARIPRGLWRSRLMAAKQAGLNCVEAPVVWGLHEPRPGLFDFEGERDIRAFVELVGELGMRCILRVGPHVGEAYDLGGLPTWLVPKVEGRVRTGEAEFLAACSSYLTKLCAQVADLQATGSSRRGATGEGPIVLVQSEHEWFCGDDATASAYLGELIRYLREGGITVPIVNRNNLYQTIEGEIDAWTGFADLFATVRQLRTVRPDQPNIVMGLETGAPDLWGEPTRSQKSPHALMRAMAETLAAGGQFNLSPFAGGTSFGFHAGRLSDAPEAFVATNRDDSGPLGQGGRRGPAYDAVKRVCTFASRFERVFAGLEPDFQPAALAPSASWPAVEDERTGRLEAKRPAGGANMSAVHASGSQGSVVFVFADTASAPTRTHSTVVTLPDGSSLPVDLGREPVAWVLYDTHLAGRATLDYCNASAFALVGTVFACFAPAGSTVMLSIGGSPLELRAPKGKTPEIVEHEGITVVLCSPAQIDTAYAGDDAVWVGVAGFDAQDRPIPTAKGGRAVRIGADGSVTNVSPSGTRPASGRVAFDEWARADQDGHVEGTSERFAHIPGPETMEALGVSSGYGWLRLAVKAGAAKKARAAFFESGDRLHLFHEGAFVAMPGEGPGADDHLVTLPLKKGEQTVTALVDNLGRFAEGNGLGEAKGLFGHVYEAKALRPGAPKLVDERPVDPFSVHAPAYGVQPGDLTDARRLSWTITHRRKSPILLRVAPPTPLACLAMLLLNGEPVSILWPGGRGRFVFDSERLNRGKNEFQIAVVGEMDAEAPNIRAGVSFFEGAASLTEGAAWSFAKWEAPKAAAFEAVTKASLSRPRPAGQKGRPCWWRGSFTLRHADAPLFFDATGLTKGHLLLNGHDVGRYFVATRTGKAVAPQSRYFLPEPWLNAGGANELLVFDEHGASPGKSALVYDPAG